MAFDWTKAYETLDEIDEDKRGAFEEKDGKFVLVKALDKGPLQRTLDAQKEEIKTLKDVKKKFETLGLEDEQIETLHDDLEDLKELRELKESGELGGDDVEKRAQEIAETRLENERKKWEREKSKYESQIKEKDETLTGTRGKLHELTLDRTAMDVAAKKGIKTEYALKTVKRFVRDEFNVNDEGEIVDRTDAGRSIDDWLDEEIASNPLLTADLKDGGSGAHGGSGSGAGRTIKRSEMDKLSRENPAKAAEVAASVRKGEAQLVD